MVATEVAYFKRIERHVTPDAATAAAAMKKMESADFHQVRGVQKGCGNFWHGIAVKDGNESHVVLPPQGQVMREGD